jgi:hypothetical protein
MADSNVATVTVNVSGGAYASSVTQHGITWTFDQPYQVGQYCNGDWWVVGPIVLLGPVSELATDPTKNITGGINGTMVNPIVASIAKHGFDYRINPSFYGQYPFYDPALNKGLNMPLAVAADSSVLSCISNPVYRQAQQLDHMACLTVVDSPPPEGSFRPTYFGSGKKTSKHNKSQIDYTKLQKLPLIAGANRAVNELNVDRAMFELGSSFHQTYLVATNNCPYLGTAYGRETTLGFALVGLELNLNYTDAQKEKMAIGMIQQGLDLYNGIVQGQKFGTGSLGGFMGGRKLPMAMAGLLLNDAAILDRLDPIKYRGSFAEDTQHFYVTQADIDAVTRSGVHPLYPNNGPFPYPQSALGMPEWGPEGGYPATSAGYNWNRVYRDTVGANLVAVALAARLSRLEQAWAHPEFLDYYDRYYEMEKNESSNSTNEIKVFVKNMWEAYRDTV